MMVVAGPSLWKDVHDSDFDGFTDPPDDMKDASELAKESQRLIAEAYSPDEIGRILGSDALHVLQVGRGKR